MAGKSIEQINREIAEAQLETAQITLEQTREENARYRATKAQKARVNVQRQEQLRMDVANRKFLSSQCTHRKGGSTRNPYKGKGKTNLNRMMLPDGFSRLINCSICRLRLFSPFPPDKNPTPRKGESANDARKRVAKFYKDEARFQKLWEEAEDALTAEAAQIMHCGTTFTFTDENGMPIMKPRPSDSYALQM